MSSSRCSWLLAGCALAPLIATPAQAAAARKHRAVHEGRSLAAEVDALKASNAALQAKVDALIASMQQTKTTAVAAVEQSTVAQAKAEHAEVVARTAQTGVDAVPVQVAAAVDKAKPKTDKIYYKGVSITLGGFVDLSGIYRTRNELSDDLSTFSRIPLPNNPLNHESEQRFSARGSRFSLLAKGDVSPSIHLTGYGEVDFLGAAQTANNNETNSYQPRLRQGWLDIDFADMGLQLTAGQTWSLATLQTKGIAPLQEAIPLTADYAYLPGFVYARQPGVRIAKRFKNGLTLAASAENAASLFGGTLPTRTTAGQPLTIVSSATPISAFNTANNYTFHGVPDVIAKAAYDLKLDGDRNLHVEAYGLYRRFTDRVNLFPDTLAQQSSSNDETGGGFGAGVYFNVVPKKLEISGSALVGSGLGRYGAGQLADITYRADGTPKPLHELLWMVGAVYHPTPQYDVYVYGGREELNGSYGVDGAGRAFGYGNPAFNNVQCFSLNVIAGAACAGNVSSTGQIAVGFWDRAYSGPFGRIQFGASYSHTKQDAFTGVGGAPNVSENIIFTSIRYFPF